MKLDTPLNHQEPPALSLSPCLVKACQKNKERLFCCKKLFKLISFLTFFCAQYRIRKLSCLKSVNCSRHIKSLDSAISKKKKVRREKMKPANKALKVRINLIFQDFQ